MINQNLKILHTAYFKCFFLYLYIYISREISIEHPSVGLASLAQLRAIFVLITHKEGGA